MISDTTLSIRDFARNFGAAPRRFWLWERLTYFRLPRPEWMKFDPDDGLVGLLDETDSLFARGKVVWGHVVQANKLLFDYGEYDCPADVVFSLKDWKNVTPHDLWEVAGILYSLKDSQPDRRDLRPIARHLTSERERAFGLPVPPVVSPEIRCHLSTTWFARKHLPDRRLAASLLPLVVSRTKPYYAMPLPGKYWPEAFVEWWCRQ